MSVTTTTNKPENVEAAVYGSTATLVFNLPHGATMLVIMTEKQAVAMAEAWKAASE